MLTAASNPQPSALTSLISSLGAKTPTDALPLQVLHNLRYQHGWTELQIHPSADSSLPEITQNDNNHLSSELSSSNPFPLLRHAPPVTLISGLPPRHVYIHPDHQLHLVAHGLTHDDVPIPREWVLPTSIAEKWTLRRLSAVFDCLVTAAPRDDVQPQQQTSAAGQDDGWTRQHPSAKRVLLAMRSHDGHSGDGTVVYYVMQEGDVKPRQN